MSNLTICFGDTVRLNSQKTGTVSFIGYTQFKPGTVFYGINLKEGKGKHNGTYDNVRYFKCAKHHGIFVEKKDIAEIIKKHLISASFHYRQHVSILDGIGSGTLLYIGLTKYDGFQNYLYGVKLHNHLSSKCMERIKKNPHLYYVHDDNYSLNTPEYFDGDSTKDAIFVRQNQLRHIVENSKSNKRKSKSTRKKISNMFALKKSEKSFLRFTIGKSSDDDKHERKENIPPTKPQSKSKNTKATESSKKMDSKMSKPKKKRASKIVHGLSISTSKETILPFNGCTTPISEIPANNKTDTKKTRSKSNARPKHNTKTRRSRGMSSPLPRAKSRKKNRASTSGKKASVSTKRASQSTSKKTKTKKYRSKTRVSAAALPSLPLSKENPINTNGSKKKKTRKAALSQGTNVRKRNPKLPSSNKPKSKSKAVSSKRKSVHHDNKKRNKKVAKKNNDLSPVPEVGNYKMNMSRSVDEWTVSDVVTWIKTTKKGKFKHYANNFKKNGVNGEDLRRLDDAHLKRIGVNRYFDRMDILNAIQNLVIDEYHATMSRYSIMSLQSL